MLSDTRGTRSSVLVGPIASLLVVFGALPSSAYAQNQLASQLTEVSICTQEWEGDTNTDMTGVYWDIFKAVFEPVGIKIKANYMPYRVSISKVSKRTCDMALGGYKNEYPDLLYPEWPLEAEAVFTLHDNDTTFEDAGSFIGKKLAWLNDYGFEMYLPLNIDHIEVRSEIVGMLMLEKGRIDYFLDYQETIQKAAADQEFDLSEYTLSPVEELSKLVYPMIRKDERGTTLADLYDHRMKTLHDNGTLDRIFGDYELGAYPAP